MTPRRRYLAACIAVVVATASCVPALREPAPLPTPETWAADPDVPDDVVDRADALWDSRELDAVAWAAVGFERRIALDRDRFESVVAAVRAWNWLARYRPDEAGRRDAAARAVRAAQWCPELRPRAPECSFWLGAALGAQARERRSTALDALPRIIELFEEAGREIPEYEKAGPDRALAVLLVRVPGFPVGPGDPELALEHARAAVDRFPAHAPNHAALAEALEGLDLDADAVAAWTTAAELADAAEAAGDPAAREWQRQARDALARLQDDRR